MELKPEDVEWSRMHFQMITVGGVWGVPRCGLLFHKENETTLVLKARMPYIDKMKESKESMEAYQQAEYDLIKAHFEAANITVKDETKPREAA